MDMAKPGWSVLDIGAGNGVLSWPLCAIGCDVRALEPSIGMRGLLYEESFNRGIDWIKVDERRWETYKAEDRFDLMMACNSLHLTEIGFERALNKIFEHNPRNIFIVTEKSKGIEINRQQNGYRMIFYTSYKTDSSFAYHSLNEAFEHYTLKKGRPLLFHELEDIKKNLFYENGHYWAKDTATVEMYWWERR